MTKNIPEFQKRPENDILSHSFLKMFQNIQHILQRRCGCAVPVVTLWLSVILISICHIRMIKKTFPSMFPTTSFPSVTVDLITSTLGLRLKHDLQDQEAN